MAEKKAKSNSKLVITKKQTTSITILLIFAIVAILLSIGFTIASLPIIFDLQDNVKNAVQNAIKNFSFNFDVPTSQIIGTIIPFISDFFGLVFLALILIAFIKTLKWRTNKKILIITIITAVITAIMIIGLILAFVTAGITIPKVLKTINDTKTITWSIFWNSQKIIDDMVGVLYTEINMVCLPIIIIFSTCAVGTIAILIMHLTFIKPNKSI